MIPRVEFLALLLLGFVQGGILACLRKSILKADGMLVLLGAVCAGLAMAACELTAFFRLVRRKR